MAEVEPLFAAAAFTHAREHNIYFSAGCWPGRTTGCGPFRSHPAR